MATTSSRHRRHRSSRKKRKQSRYVRYGWPAFLLGILLATLFARATTSESIITKDSPRGFAATVKGVREAIESNSWNEGGVIDLGEWFAAQNVDFARRAKIIKINKGYDTRDMLLEDGSRSCLIPWSVAVWEDDGGNVKVSYPAAVQDAVAGALTGSDLE